MELRKSLVFSGFSLNLRAVAALLSLAIFPNLFGFVSLPTVFGFRIHMFQYFIFLAAMLFGPAGGILAGSFGSVYTAFLLGNPYIVGGNIILGGIFGLLLKKGFPVFKAGFVAFAVQAPFLYFTDVFLAGMSHSIAVNIIAALFFGNLLWLFLAGRSYKRLCHLFQGNETQAL